MVVRKPPVWYSSQVFSLPVCSQGFGFSFRLVIGSLYSMTDSLYMLMLLNIMGPEYIVWDMAAKIEYKKPGQGTVMAEFHVPDTLISSLQELQPGEKSIFDLTVDVKDEEGDVVAHVTKTEYVKRKPID